MLMSLTSTTTLRTLVLQLDEIEEEARVAGQHDIADRLSAVVTEALHAIRSTTAAEADVEGEDDDAI